jgi:hypothetical protein
MLSRNQVPPPASASSTRLQQNQFLFLRGADGLGRLDIRIDLVVFPLFRHAKLPTSILR